MTQSAAQIPCADLNVGFRVEQVLGNEGFDPFRRRPVLCRRFGHLHQSAFAVTAELVGVETAFLPDDRLDQERVQAISRRGRGNFVVVDTVTSETGPCGQAVEGILIGQKQKGGRRDQEENRGP